MHAFVMWIYIRIMHLQQQQPNNQTTKQPNNQTTKQPNNQTTKQPNNQTTKQPNNQTTKQPNDQTTERPNDRTTERPNDRTTERPNDRTTTAGWFDVPVVLRGQSGRDFWEDLVGEARCQPESCTSATLWSTIINLQAGVVRHGCRIITFLFVDLGGSC